MAGTVKAFRLAFAEAGSQEEIEFSSRQDLYLKRWGYYSSTAFEDISGWAKEKGDAGLYRYARQIYNPVSRLVEFYVNGLYPGVLTVDARVTPDGTPIAIPFAKDSDPKLMAAAGQIWEWSNWQDNKDVFVRYAAALGDVLVKVVDDLERQKVYFEVIHPRRVKTIDLDTAGNVKGYTLEYAVTIDGNNQTYREEVTQEETRFFLDDKPANMGSGTVVKNVYGFVPAAWWRFCNLGDTYGAPAFWTAIRKIDEINDLASQISDNVKKYLESPILISGGSAVRPLGQTAERSRGPQTTNRAPSTLGILTAPEGASISTLEADVAQDVELLFKLIKSLEDDYPEITLYSDMRQMTQTTGPAADKLTGDVKNRFVSRAAAADVQTKKLIQMAVAIAGLRASDGSWRERMDYKREKFKGFNLESYASGDLDFDIEMRPVIPYGRGEYYTVALAQGQSLQAMEAAGFPLVTLLKQQGYSEAQITELLADYQHPLETARSTTTTTQTAAVSDTGAGGANNTEDTTAPQKNGSTNTGQLDVANK